MQRLIAIAVCAGALALAGCGNTATERAATGGLGGAVISGPTGAGGSGGNGGGGNGGGGSAY